MWIVRSLWVLWINQPQMQSMPVLVVNVSHKLSVLGSKSSLVLGGETLSYPNIGVSYLGQRPETRECVLSVLGLGTCELYETESCILGLRRERLETRIQGASVRKCGCLLVPIVTICVGLIRSDCGQPQLGPKYPHKRELDLLLGDRGAFDLRAVPRAVTRKLRLRA